MTRPLVLFTCAAMAWPALLIAAPLLPVPVAAVLYALGSQICHQRPERSFHFMSAQLPVCARCLGIYAGSAAGFLFATTVRSTRRSPRVLLLIGAIPTLITLAVEWTGASGVSNATRAVAGIPLGCAVALVVARAVATLHYGGCAPRRPIASNRPPTPI